MLSINIASADTEQCTKILNVMTDLTYNYADALKACRQIEKNGENSSRQYEGYRRVARDTEKTYAKAQNVCYQVCDDTFFCEEGLSGACLK